ncbi:MAG: hypothetical protein ACYC5Y_04680 [Symbiobacteriia bacterium]
MASTFARVLRAAPDLPAQGPEPYIRITTFAADDLGIPEPYTYPPQNRAVRLLVGSRIFHATWELYTIEGDTGPTLRLTRHGLNMTGLTSNRSYLASYDPETKILALIRPLSGK